MRLYYFTLGFFLLTEQAVIEDFQGYHTGQTKDTTATKQTLLETERTVAHNEDTISREKTYQRAAVTEPVKFQGTVSYDSRPMSPYGPTQPTNTSLITAPPSREVFISGNGRSSLTSTRDDPSKMRSPMESEIPLKFNYEEIVLTSPQTAFESVMNDTSEPQIQLSAEAMKASLRFDTVVDNRKQRNTESVAFTSADGGPGVPTLSPSHPSVIDNPAALLNNSDDKRSPNRNEKGFSNLGGSENLQVILHSDTADDSVRVTNLCLTCLRDRTETSTEKSVALPTLTQDGSSDTRSTEGLISGFSQFTTSLQSSRQQQVEVKETSHQNKATHSSVSVRERLLYNLTSLSSDPQKTQNHIQSASNDSQIKSFFSDTGTAALPEVSSGMHNSMENQSKHMYPSKTFVTERPVLTTTAFYRSSKLLFTVRKPAKHREQDMKGITGVLVSEPIYLNKLKNDSQSLLMNLKNIFAQIQPLATNSGLQNNLPMLTTAPLQNQRSISPGDSDHRHPAGRTSLNETHGSITLHSLGRQTTSASKNTESHSNNETEDSFISVASGQIPAKPSSQSKAPILSLKAPVKSVTRFASVTAMTDRTGNPDSHTFSTVNRMAKQTFVDSSESGVQEQHTPPFTTTNVDEPVKLFLTKSRQDFDAVESMSVLTTLSRKAFFNRLTISSFLGSQSNMTKGSIFDVGSDKHTTPAHQSVIKSDGDFIRETLIDHSLKERDKNEQVLTVVVQDEDKEITETEGEQGDEIKESKEKQMLPEEGEAREDEKFESSKEKLFRSDKKEILINTEGEAKENPERDTIEEKTAKAHQGKNESVEMSGEVDAAVRRVEIKDDKGGKIDGVKTTNAKSFSTDEINDNDRKLEKEPVTKQGAEDTGEETMSKEDIKSERGIGREDMTNVPLGPTTNSGELNRDKGHTVTNPSSCQSLAKKLGVTKRKGTHLGENIAQIVEMENKPFSDEVTSNHRPLHSTLRSQSPKLSKMTALLKESHTQLNPQLSGRNPTLTQHKVTNTPTDKTLNEGTVSAVDIPNTPFTFNMKHHTLKHMNSPQTSPIKSASHSENISEVVSLTTITPQLVITDSSSSLQPQFTSNSSTLSVSVIHSVSGHDKKSHTSFSEATSLLQNAAKKEPVIPLHKLESGVKDSLTSHIFEKVNISTPLDAAPHQRMYNESSRRPPTAVALSSEAGVSTGQLQPQRGQSTPEISQSLSYSFDMTSGQPCSFKLSEKMAHSDALHAPVDDNEWRSAQTLIASMSPKAKNNQFPLSSMPPPLNLILFRGDSLPGTDSLTGLTRSASEKEILRTSTYAEYANSPSGHAEPFFGTFDEANQNEDNSSEQTTANAAVTRSNTVTKQRAGKRDEKTSSHFIAQVAGRNNHHANMTDKFTSFTGEVTKSTNESNHIGFRIDGKNKANHAVTTNIVNNHTLSQTHDDSYIKAIVSAIHTTPNTEQAGYEQHVPVINSFLIPVLDKNSQVDIPAFVESDSLPEKPKTQASDVAHYEISDVVHDIVETTEKQHDPFIPQRTVGTNLHPVTHDHFANDSGVNNMPLQQIGDQMNEVTFGFRTSTTESNDYASMAPVAHKTGVTASTEPHESALSTIEIVQAVIEKSSQATHAEHILQSNRHIEPLSLREPSTTPTTGKHTPAVKRKNTREMGPQHVKQPEHEMSVQAIEQSQHAVPGMIRHPINNPDQDNQAAMLKDTDRAGRPHDTPASMKNVKTALTTLAPLKAYYSSPGRTSTVNAITRTEQQKKHELPVKTLTNRATVTAVTDSVPPTASSPTERTNKTSCGTTGCDMSVVNTETIIGTGETDRPTVEETYKAKTGNERDHLKRQRTVDEKRETEKFTGSSLAGKTTPQLSSLDKKRLSPGTELGIVIGDESTKEDAKSLTKVQSVHVENDHWERSRTPVQSQFLQKTTQRHSHREDSTPQQSIGTEVTLSELEATSAQTTENNTEIYLNRRAAKAQIIVAHPTRSARAVAREEPRVPESERRLLLLESELDLPRLKHGRKALPHRYLSGVTEVSDDVCGSGNYTAEMSLNLGRGVEPGDAVPALGNLRVVINLKTNNSRINLGVTSCCLSPTIQPDFTNSTCCLFSRLAAEPAGITLLPSALSTSASFTISLFQMINYSVAYLHCDLSVCLRNRSDCERQCLQQRNAFSLEGPDAFVTNLRNRISFGPMLKEVANTTFPEEIDPSGLDLVLVLVSLVVGCSLVTVMLLLVWLAYRRRTVWLLRSAAPPQACCGCVRRRGGDLILP